MTTVSNSVVGDGALLDRTGGGRLVDVAGGSEVGAAVTSFEHFYRSEAAAIQRSLTATLGSQELASEATAEAMARAYAHWPKVRTYDNPAAWVYRVGLNWSTSRWRKRRREVLTAHEHRAASSHAPNDGDPALDRALALLPVDQRAVVVLRLLLDWSEADTAAAIGVPAGTVKSRLNRAMSRLADLLEGHDDPDA